MRVCVKMMSKGLKEALTVLIITHVTEVERVESGVCSFYATLHTEYCYSFSYSCQKGQNVKYYVLYSVYRESCPCQEGSLDEPSVLEV